jgi:NAD(P)-dependent dehydrogenase (short-subunit alcohol dehydrogenase family)
MNKELYVVVGGSKVGGIGMGVTEVLGAEGSLIVTGATREEVMGGNAHLESKGIDAVSMVVDVLNPSDVEALVAKAKSFGNVKGVVIITGLTPACGDWKLIMRVNLLGVTALMKAFADVMEPNSSFVLFSSSSPYQLKRETLDAVDGLLYESDTCPEFMEKIAPTILSEGEEMAVNLSYPISKRGVQLIVRKYAVLLGGKGIRVNSVAPGLADTLRNQELINMSQNMREMVEEMTPSKRMGSLVEMGNVVAFLLSDKASFVSGIDVLIDGACLANMHMRKRVEQF